MTILAQLDHKGRKAPGVDYAKLARLRSELEMKVAAIDGALRLMHELREDHQRQRLSLELGMSTYGRQLWTSRDEADLLKLSTEDQRQGHVDVRAVHQCLALRDRRQRVEASVAAQSAEIVPLRALVASCDHYIEGAL